MGKCDLSIIQHDEGMEMIRHPHEDAKPCAVIWSLFGEMFQGLVNCGFGQNRRPSES